MNKEETPAQYSSYALFDVSAQLEQNLRKFYSDTASLK